MKQHRAAEYRLTSYWNRIEIIYMNNTFGVDKIRHYIKKGLPKTEKYAKRLTRQTILGTSAFKLQ